MSSSHRPSVKYTICGASIQTNNLARHRREVHKFEMCSSTPVQSVTHNQTLPTQARSRSTSQETHCSSIASHSHVSRSVQLLRWNGKAGIDMAATKLLTQHQMYTASRLVKFLKDNCPNVKLSLLEQQLEHDTLLCRISLYRVTSTHLIQRRDSLLLMLTFCNRGLNDEAYTPSLSTSVQSAANNENDEIIRLKRCQNVQSFHRHRFAKCCARNKVRADVTAEGQLEVQNQHGHTQQQLQSYA